MHNNTPWLELIKGPDFYQHAENAYQQHLADNTLNYTLHRGLVDLKWDHYLRYNPDQKTFFTKEKKGVVRPDAEQEHVASNVMGEHHFLDGESELDEICNQLNLDYADVTLNKQLPGNQVGVHVDLNRNLFLNFYPKETATATVSELRKFIVFLEPWSLGQVFCLGTSALTDWQQGDVIEFPWHMPHYTANCSKVSRSILFIAGVKFND